MPLPAPIAPLPLPADMALCRRWTATLLTDATRLPVTFKLDGQVIRGIPADWRPVVSTRALDANLLETVFAGRHPTANLAIRVEATTYRDYPVVEWLAWLSNPAPVGSKSAGADSPRIADLQGLDATFDGTTPVLTHCNGDFNSADGYTPTRSPILEGQPQTYAPTGGRSCDRAFPYYRLQFANCGLTLAIGWPGQWAARFSAATGGSSAGVRIAAGQQTVNLVLHPGEKIRTPRITLMAWHGDETRATNLWRRWYRDHILPRPDGRPLAPVYGCATTDPGEEFTEATEANQIRYIDNHRKHGLPFDAWWIDAGWYPCLAPDGKKLWWRTGTWQPDPARFPRGLKPIADHLAKTGARLLLWFEPERVHSDTALDLEHNDWLLKGKGRDSRLFDLGNPAAHRWLTDHVCGLIKDNGVKIYRQDFNFEPLPYWQENDAPDRLGILENLHVQGYLNFWDEIIARNPGIWIDSCASGGRRNDLETMRRSVPLHYSDFGYGNIPVKLAFHRTMYEWIPFFKDIALDWDQPEPAKSVNPPDSYVWHSGFAPMFMPALDMKRDDFNFPLAHKLTDLWRKAAPNLLEGDFYPATPFHKDPAQWVGWQFDRPERGQGCLQAIRLPQATAESLTFMLCGLDSNAVYNLENPETGAKETRTGAVLMQAGFTITLPKRNAAIWLYQRQPQ